MHRQSPGRNLRSKGIKVKHVLQIFLLLAVCFWLIYQVKHSHDKKKEFDESDAKSSLIRESSDTLIRLGRKDMQPRLEEIINMSEKRDATEEEEEETAGEDVEENKHEDEPEDKRTEAKGYEDDEMDESGREKLDVEVDKGDDFIDDKETGNGDENEIEEKDSEDDNGQMEKESSTEETDHDGDDTSTHEAREEHYKADDASSAVTHDTQIGGIENENEHEEKSHEQPENIVEQEFKENDREETNKGEKRKELEEEGREIDKDVKQSNVTNSEAEVDNFRDNSSLNDTVTEVSENDSETSNSSSVVTTENHNLSLPNVTVSESNLDHGQEILTEDTSTEGSNFHAIDMERANNSTLNVEDNQFVSNSTGPNETKDSNSEEFAKTPNDPEPSSEKNDASKAEKSDTNDNKDEILEPEKNENPQQILLDAIDLSDSSNSLEEKDVRTDLDMLPEIRTEGTNNEDAAAE